MSPKTSAVMDEFVLGLISVLLLGYSARGDLNYWHTDLK